MKILQKFIAFVVIFSLLVQVPFSKVQASNSAQVVYYDGIEFFIQQFDNYSIISTDYKDYHLVMTYNYIDNTSEATIEYGKNEEETYDININKSSNSFSANIYDKSGQYVGQIANNINTYEGQIAIAAGSALVTWLLSAGISVALTYAITQAIGKGDGSNRKRGAAIPISNSEVPGPEHNNKKVQQKNGTLDRRGTKNSSIENYDSNGKLLQRRYYDETGYAIMDVDFSHGGNETFPHIHIWQ